MDKTSVMGVLIGILAIGTGMILKGVSIAALLNPAALLIIFAGTAAALLIAFPLNKIKKLPKLFTILFTDQKIMTMPEVIAIFMEWAFIARKEGLLALEPKSDEIDDPFLKQGIKMIVDGQSPDFIQDVLLKDLETMEERHLSNASLFSQAGTYAPTLGVLGAVIGLVAALGNMNDIEALGEAISAAFIATLFGIFSGYVLWHPFANKLKHKSQQEMKVKEIMIEGLLSIQDGTSPKVLEEKLLTYVSASERQQVKEGVNIA
ncbi:flagellar motor protein MotA [Fictibacillus macauensis ZFHKF-1]|uniref:Flagellar motor protein MotA n=1 Tax=Fictibacillus macauensis ZFHKF-1 TaxID=1196324 RepID=I8UFW8_9BACL|nr:flagellar motor stator protein MotA [Fictibacillus macauensis]EIT85795.1 flagellar motor protein MotA [Fictibacillus macauensis ZFHKF-1]